MKKRALISGVAFSILIISLFSVSALNFLDRISSVQRFSDMSEIKGAWSTLRTDKNGASFNLHTSGLGPGHAVTVWWVIFNKPENCGRLRDCYEYNEDSEYNECSDYYYERPYRCGMEDLPPYGGDDSAETSVVYGDGHVIGWRGIGDFNDKIVKGDTKGALWGPGLTNPEGADIHLVVRDHGRILWYLTREMTQTLNGGCADELDDSEDSGLNECFDIQFSVHEQEVSD